MPPALPFLSHPDRCGFYPSALELDAVFRHRSGHFSGFVEHRCNLDIFWP